MPNPPHHPLARRDAADGDRWARCHARASWHTSLRSRGVSQTCIVSVVGSGLGLSRAHRLRCHGAMVERGRITHRLPSFSPPLPAGTPIHSRTRAALLFASLCCLGGSSGSLSRRAKQFGCMSRSHWTWPRRETDCDCEVQAVSGDQMIIGFSSRPAFRPQRTRCMHPRQKKDVH